MSCTTSTIQAEATILAPNERSSEDHGGGGGAALLGKACDVLDAIAAAPGGMTRAELAEKLSLPRTTLYRILATLVARGLLRQDPTRRAYAVGFRLFEIAQGAWSNPDLLSVAAPELRALRDATGETAYLAVLEGREVVSLGKFEGAHEIRSAARLGQRKKLHCTSQGKAILAFLPNAEKQALLRKLVLSALTDHTITDHKRLDSELALTAARGFAIDDEEIALGVRCVGAPILDAAERVHGAISIAGPAWRMTRPRLDQLGPELAAAGRRIGAQLRPPAPAQATSGVRAMPGHAAFAGMAPLDRDGNCIWWADALAPELRLLQSETHDRSLARLAAPLRAMAPSQGGGALVFDVEGGVTRFGGDGVQAGYRLVAPLAELLTASVHPDGALWVAMRAPDTEGSLIGPLEPDGRIDTVWRLRGEATSLCWSPSGALYAGIAGTGAIHRLEPGRGVPLLLTRMPGGAGMPVALTCDIQGGVWVALQDGWSVVRLGGDGEVDRVIALPVPRPSGICFGGPGHATLYVATSRDGLSLDALAAAPLSGRLLAVDPGTPGFAETATDWR